METQDNRIPVCPIILEKGSAKVPDRFVRITINGGRQYGHHIESVQTVGDLLDSMKVEDSYSLDRDAFVIWKHQTKNVYCGGECVYAFGVAKKEVNKWIDEPTAFMVYISLTEDGRLVTAFPG